MEDRWKQVEAWIETNAPALASSLQPPATEAAIEEAEQRLDLTFPPSVRQSYLRHDGETDSFAGVLGYRFLTLDELVNEAESLREIDEDFDYDFWGDSLIPLFAVGNGDLLCVSDAPDGEETAFRRWDHESSAREELEPSFPAFVDTVLETFEAGEYEYNEERGWLTVNVSVRQQ